jgi:hypothetical protein
MREQATMNLIVKAEVQNMAREEKSSEQPSQRRPILSMEEFVKKG